MNRQMGVLEKLKFAWDASVALIKGLGVTGKHLFHKPVTIQYPDEKLPVPSNYRGNFVWSYELCTACFLCAKVCPSLCIEIDPEIAPTGKRIAKSEIFTVDLNLCAFCGFCVEACPHDCILMTPEYDFAAYSHDEFVLTREKLMARSVDYPFPKLVAKQKKEAEAKAAAKAAAAATAGAPSSAPGASTATMEKPAAPEPAQS